MPQSQKELSLELRAMPGSGLWTGDADMKMSYIKATSILGGLRFWTEALLRSLGQEVCHEKLCLHPKSCAACRIFGCTGLSRAFSLNVVSERMPGPSDHESRMQTYPPRPGQTRPAYYQFKSGYPDVFTLIFAVHRPSLEDGAFALPPEMLTALALMVEYGTLGARDQYGCGLVSPTRNEDREKLLSAAGRPTSAKPQSNPGLSLQDFFFFKGSVKTALRNNDAMTLSLDLRRAVREKARGLKNEAFRHWFCGSLQPDQPGDRFTGDGGKNNSGSKYNLAVTADGRLYGWGHFSRHLPQRLEGYSRFREKMLNAMKKTLEEGVENLVWKEFDSARDNCKSPADWTKYLAHMLDSRWR